MARGSSLSDDRVIKEINDNFIAVDDNLTEQGFPPNTHGLDGFSRWISTHNETNHGARDGFVASAILSPDGQTQLGSSGSGTISQWKTATCYVPDKYLSVLLQGRQNYDRYAQIAQMPDSA